MSKPDERIKPHGWLIGDDHSMPPELVRFQAESNRIEGIDYVKAREVEALQTFLGADPVSKTDLIAYVRVIQPDALIRDSHRIPSVRVDNHVAPPSGEDLMRDLDILLDRVNGQRANLALRSARDV